MNDWTLITDVMGNEVLKSKLIKGESKRRSIIVLIKCLNILVNCECNISVKNICKWNKFKWIFWLNSMISIL